MYLVPNILKHFIYLTVRNNNCIQALGIPNIILIYVSIELFVFQ